MCVFLCVMTRSPPLHPVGTHSLNVLPDSNPITAAHFELLAVPCSIPALGHMNFVETVALSSHSSYKSPHLYGPVNVRVELYIY